MDLREAKVLLARRRELIRQAKSISERYIRREQQHIAKSGERINNIEADIKQTKTRIAFLKKEIYDVFGEIDDINNKLGD